MKLSAKILSIAAIISLVGCAAFSYTEEQKAGFVEMAVTRESDIDLCVHYLSTEKIVKTGELGGAFYSAEFARKSRVEAQRRGLLNAVDIQSLPNKKFRVGSSKCGLLAVWGRPEDSNKTVTTSGVDVQWVYCTERTTIGSSTVCLKQKYAYTSNGIVTAWQE